MKTVLKLLLLVLILNLIRYFVGGPIEAFTIMEPMHSVMPQYPQVFDNDFDNIDFSVSLFYNFMMWLTVVWVFHVAHPALRGSWISKSLRIFALMCLFFISLAAVYMNHYNAPVKKFYLFSMVDALIVFAIVGLANGILYPRIFKRS